MIANSLDRNRKPKRGAHFDIKIHVGGLLVNLYHVRIHTLVGATSNI